MNTHSICVLKFHTGPHPYVQYYVLSKFLNVKRHGNATTPMRPLCIALHTCMCHVYMDNQDNK